MSFSDPFSAPRPGPQRTPREADTPFAVDAFVDRFDLIHLLRRYGWLVVALPILLAGIAVAVHLARTPLYESSALLMVDSSLDQLLEFESKERGGQSNQESLKSLEIAIVADSVLLRVVEKLGLREASGFLPEKMVAEPNLPDAKLLQFLRKNRIRASLEPETRLIRVSVLDTDRERSARIAEAFVGEFESFLADQRKKEVAAVRGNIEEQVIEAKNAALESEERLREFRESVEGLPLEQDHDFFGARLTQFGTDLNEAVRMRVELESVHQSLSKMDPATDAVDIIEVSGKSDASFVADVLTALATSRSRLAMARQQYTASHPGYLSAAAEVERNEAQVRELAADVKSTSEARYRAAQEKETLLQKELARLQDEFVAVKAKGAEFRALKEEAENRWLHHQAIQKRLSDNIISAEMPGSVATVVSEPLVPYEPAGPSPILIAAVGGAFGCFLLATVLALLVLRGFPVTHPKQLESRFGSVPVVDDDRDGVEGVALVASGTSAIHVSSPGGSRIALGAAERLVRELADAGGVLLVTVRDRVVDPCIRETPVPGCKRLEIGCAELLDPAKFATALPKIRSSFSRVVIVSERDDAYVLGWIASLADGEIVVVEPGRDAKSAVAKHVERLRSGGGGHRVAFFLSRENGATFGAWVGSGSRRGRGGSGKDRSRKMASFFRRGNKVA